MSFVEILQAYFRGERIEALYYILPAGLLMIGLGVTALATDRGGFGWGLAVPLFLFGLVGVGTGAHIALRTPPQVAELTRLYEQAPTQMLAVELPRMEQVNANWPRLMAAWLALVLIGLVLRFAIGADWAHGVGPALILIGAVGFLIDGFAERRAQPYTQALQVLSQQHAAS